MSNEGQNYADNTKYFYLKDHLGSVRAVYDVNLNLMSAQDYDAWGYTLDDRTYNDTSIYKFTGKERDRESTYDYFGARYYDSRIGNFLSPDPLFAKHIQWTPYNYVLRNPLVLIDPDGRQVNFSDYINYAPNAKSDLNELMKELTFFTALNFSIKDDNLVISGEVKSQKKYSETARKKIQEYIKGKHNVLYSTDGCYGAYTGTANFIGLDPKQIGSFKKGVKGSSNEDYTLLLGWALSFFHEIEHNVKKMNDPSTFGEIGEIEEIPNMIRDEMDLPERLSYKSKSFKENGSMYIPFDVSSRSRLYEGKSPDVGIFIEYK